MKMINQNKIKIKMSNYQRKLYNHQKKTIKNKELMRNNQNKVLYIRHLL